MTEEKTEEKGSDKEMLEKATEVLGEFKDLFGQNYMKKITELEKKGILIQTSAGEQGTMYLVLSKAGLPLASLLAVPEDMEKVNAKLQAFLMLQEKGNLEILSKEEMQVKSLSALAAFASLGEPILKLNYILTYRGDGKVISDEDELEHAINALREMASKPKIVQD